MILYKECYETINQAQLFFILTFVFETKDWRFSFLKTDFKHSLSFILFSLTAAKNKSWEYTFRWIWEGVMESDKVIGDYFTIQISQKWQMSILWTWNSLISTPKKLLVTKFSFQLLSIKVLVNTKPPTLLQQVVNIFLLTYMNLNCTSKM